MAKVKLTRIGALNAAPNALRTQVVEGTSDGHVQVGASVIIVAPSLTPGVDVRYVETSPVRKVTSIVYPDPTVAQLRVSFETENSVYELEVYS